MVIIIPTCLRAVGLKIDLPKFTVIVRSSLVVDSARLDLSFARVVLLACPRVTNLWLTNDQPKCHDFIRSSLVDDSAGLALS